MDPTSERAIAERAHAQLGLVTTAQLAAASMSRRTRSRRVHDGLLVPVGVHTYRLAGAPTGPHVEVLATCLDLGAAASHRTAAWLHGLHPQPPRIDVTVVEGASRGRVPTRPDRRVHSSTNLPTDDVVRVGPIPTTSVARTLLGVAALPGSEVGSDALTAMVEDAVRRRRASDRWLWWLLEQRRCRGRNGVRRFAAVLARRAALGPTESWLEREVLRVLERAGLPLPLTQQVVRRRGAFVARVDFLYPDERIVLEAQGHTTHATRSALSADAARTSGLTLLGFEVHQVTYDQVVRDPAGVADLVATALAGARRRAAS